MFSLITACAEAVGRQAGKSSSFGEGLGATEIVAIGSGKRHIFQIILVAEFVGQHTLELILGHDSVL